LAAFLYLIGFIAFPAIARRVGTRYSKHINAQSLSMILALVLLVELAAINVLPQTSRVGRLPALIGWSSSLQVGNFPYHTSTEPSGFPFLFMLAYPFYLIGNLGYLEVLGTLLFGIVVLKYEKYSSVGFVQRSV
jgi:hypothetical protein